MRRVVLVLVVIAVAYAVGWISGSSEVLVLMFAFTLVAGFALFNRFAPAIRVTAVLAAGAVAFAEIFLF